MGEDAGFYKNCRLIVAGIGIAVLGAMAGYFWAVGGGDVSIQTPNAEPSSASSVEPSPTVGHSTELTPRPGFILWESDCAHDEWTVKIVPLPGGGNRVTCFLDTTPIPTPTAAATPHPTVTQTPTGTATATATPTETVTPTPTVFAE